MRELEYVGMWWLPQWPDKKVAGILKFDSINGAHLQLIGGTFINQILDMFGTENKEDKSRSLNIGRELVVLDIILGHTSGEKDVTLYKCSDYSILGGGFSIGGVFVDNHFEKGEDIVFKSITISYSNLEHWLGLTGFSGSFSFPPEPSSLDVEIKYETPSEIKTKVGKYEIAFYTRLDSLPASLNHSVSLNEIAYIEIKPKTPMHYNEFHKTVIYYLRNFISLGLDMPTAPKIVFGEIADSTESQDSENLFKPKTVSIYYVAKGASLLEEPRNRGENLFLHKHIEDEFERSLNLWFEKSERLLDIQDLYFGLLYVPPMYIQLEYLTLAQAIEGYHRILYGAKHGSKNFTLKMRIDDILNRILGKYKSTLNRYIPDYETFGNEFVGIRNRLTHPSQNSVRMSEAELTQLYWLVKKSHLLLQMCFLAEMELSVQVVETILENKFI